MSNKRKILVIIRNLLIMACAIIFVISMVVFSITCIRGFIYNLNNPELTNAQVTIYMIRTTSVIKWIIAGCVSVVLSILLDATRVKMKP